MLISFGSLHKNIKERVQKNMAMEEGGNNGAGSPPAGFTTPPITEAVYRENPYEKEIAQLKKDLSAWKTEANRLKAEVADAEKTIRKNDEYWREKIKAQENLWFIALGLILGAGQLLYLMFENEKWR